MEITLKQSYIILIFLLFYSVCFGQNVIKPELVAESGGEDLTNVMDLDFKVYEDGKIEVYVADIFTPSVLVLYNDGKNLELKHHLGREGQGPGEFIEINNLDLVNNNLLSVYDRNLTRVTLFDVNGAKTAGEFTIQRTGESHFPMEVYASGNDSIFYSKGGHYFTDDYDKNAARNIVLQSINRRGELIVDSVLVKPDDEAFVYMSGGNMSVNPNPIWGKKSIIRFKDDKIYYAWGGSSEIYVHNQNGKLLKAISINLPQIPITEDDKNRALNLEAKMMDFRKRRIRGEVYEAMSSDNWPWFRDFHVDDKINFWIALPAHMKDEERIWQVWNKDGEMIKEFRLPSDFTVHQIKQNFIAGELFDMGDFTSKVQLYKVEKF